MSMSMHVRNGLKTEPEKVQAMRELREGGYSRRAIANQLNVSWSTVDRYCSDIRIATTTPLTDAERQALLTTWGLVDYA